MKRTLKWVAGASLIAFICLSGFAVCWWAESQKLFTEVYPQPRTTFAYDPSTANIDSGKRIATISGCFDGCHGKGVEGRVFFDDLKFGVFNAPNLTQLFAEMSDAELDATIRYGIRRDGTSNIVMPSNSFHHMSDMALNDMVGYIRSLPLSHGPGYDVEPGVLTRYLVVSGRWVPRARMIRDEAPWFQENELPHRLANGKFLALTACGECHGMDHNGFEHFGPGLAASLAYSEEDFRVLLRKGVPIGDRQLGLMAEVASVRFSLLTDEEIEDLRRYLHAYFRNEL